MTEYGLNETTVVGNSLLRVYHFILDHRVGGPHVYVDTLNQALKGKIDSVIVTTGQGPITDIALLNLRYLWAPLYAIEMIVNAVFLVYLVLSRRIKRKNAIFNVHGSANIAPIIAARIVGIPVVWHFHESLPHFRRLVTIGRWLLHNHPHTLVVVANKAKEAYRLENAVIIPAAVDTSFWSQNSVDKDAIDGCGWSGSQENGERPFRVLAIGNLNPLKGMDILLEAFAAISGHWHVKIAGAELETHKKYAAKLYEQTRAILSVKTECAIEFLGWQDKTQVRALLASCDIFVLPSRSEAGPIVLLEAMAMDCNCLAADVGDVRTLMGNYSRGRVFPAGSVQDLRKGIKHFQDVLRIPSIMSELTDSIWQIRDLSAKTMVIYNSLTGKD